MVQKGKGQIAYLPSGQASGPQRSAFGFGLVSKEKSMQALDMLLILPLMVYHLRGRRT